MIVLKFGGTSVADATRIKNVAQIIQSAQYKEQSVLVVLSAVAGTTDSLVKIVENLKHSEIETAEQSIDLLIRHYQNIISTLYKNELIRHKANEFILYQFKEIFDAAKQRFVPAIEYHILAKGELISTELLSLLFEEQSINCQLLCSLDFMRTSQNGAPDMVFLEKELNQKIVGNKKTKIYITQGFICRNAFGEISNLKRGGSDYSASLFGAAINAKEVQIWTDIDGMHNNDPRYVKATRPIRELSFDEAAELAYFGAKILHPASIKPARKKNIPVRLLNTLEPSAVGTLISSKTTSARIKAVAAKDGITAIKIKSSEMLQAPGFLRRIFEVFELYHTSIDMITTSEVAVSVTIDDTTYLESIVNTLVEFGQVDVDKNLSIICVVGEFLVESKGVALQVIQALQSIPIRMISYGGSPHNISLLVSSELKIETLNALHQGLFND